MNARQVRALRGSAATAGATLVSATAHTLAGGGAPSPALVAAVAVLAAPLAVLLVGRGPSPLRTGAAVVLSQAVFHVAFVVAGSLGPVAPHGSHRDHGAMTASVTASLSHTALIPDAPMLLAHALAAALTVVAFARGERMLRAIARGIVRLLPSLWCATPPAVAARPRIAASAPRVVVDLHLRASPTRRGPPALAR